MKQVIEGLVLPPLGLYVMIAAGLIVAAWGRRSAGRRTALWFGRILAIGGGGALVAMSVPYVAFALLDSLQTDPAIDPAETSLPVGAIAVLAADVDCDPPEYGPDQPGSLSMLRSRYGAALSRRTGLPLLISGGVLRPDRRPVSHVLADFVDHELGVPVRWREGRSTDTRQNAAFSAEILRAEGIASVALVTHAWHMPRAKRAFEQAGLEVLPAPTAAATSPSKWTEGLIPRASSFRDSSWALHEWAGRIWYRLTE